MKSHSLSTVAKRLSTSALVIAMTCSVANPLAYADEGAASSQDTPSSSGSPKIELKKPERSQPVQSTITASASASASASGQAAGLHQRTQSSVSLQSGQPKSSGSPSSGSKSSGNTSSGFASASAGGFASASGNGAGGGQVFGSATASGSIQAGSAPSASSPSAGTARSVANGGESVSRSTIKENDNEITVVSAVAPRQEITIRQSSEDGIELQLKPRSRSGKADDAAGKKTKTFKAASLEEFKTKHAKLYPLVEKYLLTEPKNPVTVAATGNEAQAMATKQIEQMIEQNAGNPQLQNALRQSLDAIKSAQ